MRLRVGNHKKTRFVEFKDSLSLPFLLIRCRVDMIAFIFRYVAISGLTITIGVLGILPEFGFRYFNVVPTVLLIIGLALLSRNFLEIWQLERGVILKRRTELSHFSDSYISNTYAGFRITNYSPKEFSGSVGDGGMGTVITSDELDAQLLTRKMYVRWIDRKFKVDTSLRGYIPAILRQINENRRVFNGRCVRMNTDLRPQSGGESIEITMSPTSYFDFICSNELFRYKVSDRRSAPELKTLGELGLVDYDNKFFDLSGSRLANVVGVSIVALTKDGYLILTRQTSYNSVNADLLLSTGSGSLDLRDVEVCRSKNSIERGQDLKMDLDDLISAGMLREMEEESGISKANCTDTQIVGYSRWLDRGGKPEFYGFTVLNLDYEEVLRRKVKGLEKAYSKNSEGVRAKDLQWDEISNLQFESLGKELSKSVALPLAFNLRAIAKHLGNSSAHFRAPDSLTG